MRIRLDLDEPLVGALIEAAIRHRRPVGLEALWRLERSLGVTPPCGCCGPLTPEPDPHEAEAIPGADQPEEGRA